ncbi:MAG: blaD [Alphaproteobacteria bacterium]|jgi:beta-lactamase class D|nr:blaD [Alphaproteobacteria bacterium]MDF3033532.1 blaD [Alphaproteobacteria bacterium]
MRRKSAIMALLGCLFINLSGAATECFIAKEGGKILQKEGDCAQAYSPCSTFKIVIALIGYDEGILKDATTPAWIYGEQETLKRAVCKGQHTPSTWMKNSCVWYSQMIMQKVGMEKFKGYVEKLRYGNQDVAGDDGKDNGLTQAWLESSLKISPEGQVHFLESLIHSALPVSAEAQAFTRALINLEVLPNGWQLYGKTGGGDRQGWFVGWIQKGNRHIVFAQYIAQKKDAPSPLGLVAKEKVKEKLAALLK